MPTVTLKLDQYGKLVGATEQDNVRYAKFKERVATLENSCIQFKWSEPRSGPFHARHFCMINALFESQEQFVDQDQFRKWLEAGAGFADIVPGPKGKPIAVVKSIAYDKMDQNEFEQVHRLVFQFARTEHARRFLWPHLSDTESWRMVESALAEFDLP